MIIKRIELTNWGPHKSLKADLLANVVGVIGGNGRGKSNFLQAIDYGLNGNLNKQNKELYIYNFGKEDGATKATVKIEFSKNGQDGEITRTISKSGSTRKLIWEGREYKSDAEVSAQMTKIMGADKAAMANAIFIKQGCLAALVKGTPAERLSIFQKLMNLSFLDSRYNDLHNKIEKLKSGITDYRPALDVLVTQLKATKDSIQSLQGSIREDPSESIAHLDATIELTNKVESSRNSVAVARGKLFNATEHYKKLCAESELGAEDDIASLITSIDDTLRTYDIYVTTKAEVCETTRTVADLKNTLTELKKQIQSQEAVVLSADAVEELRKKKKELYDVWCVVSKKEDLTEKQARLQNEITQLKKDVLAAEAKLKEVNATTNITSLDSLIDSRASDITALRLRKEFLESGTTHGGTCPVCGAGMRAMSDEDIRNWLTEVTSQLAEATTQFEKLRKMRKTMLNTITEAEHTVHIHKTLLIRKVKELSDTEESLKQLPTSEDKTLDGILKELNTIEDTINNNAEQTSVLMSYKSKLAVYSKTFAATKRKLQQQEECLKAASEQVDDTVNKDELLAKRRTAELLLRNLTEAKAAINSAKKLVSTFTDMEQVSVVLLEDSPGPNYIANKFFNGTIPGKDSLLELKAKLQEELEAYMVDNATLTSLKTSFIELTKKQQELNEKIKAEEGRLQLISDLETVGRITNKNGLPLAYMNSIFDHITGMVQEMLAKMGANFTVIKDDERPCTFRFIRTDDTTGYAMPQEMLSGGQAIRLSLALLIACQQLILPEVGLLVLDEPSSHMDAEGVDSLKELFLQMTSIFHSSETQLITVDHNPSLIAALEKVIQL